ncbi:hypothetical protein CBL_08590 [Carabus blaptoides fortunei]
METVRNSDNICEGSRSQFHTTESQATDLQATESQATESELSNLQTPQSQCTYFPLDFSTSISVKPFLRFSQQLAFICGISVVISEIIEPFAPAIASTTVDEENLPSILIELYKDNLKHLSHAQLLSLRRDISLSITVEDCEAIETNRLRTTPQKISIEKIYKTKYENVYVVSTGLHLSISHPQLGASPDGIITCSYCGTGCFEVKCPFSKKNEECNMKDYAMSKKMKRSL